MSLKREETEIRDQAHLMDAEGTSDEKPLVKDIENLLNEWGWLVYDVDIFHDDMQGFWRWNCKIIKP